MKKTRRIAAFAAAMAMAATMAMPMASFADEVPAKTIIIEDNGSISAKNHKFEAYQIFTGTLNDSKNGFTGSSVAFGANVTPATLIQKLKGAGFTGDAATAVAALTEYSTAYVVSQAIEKVTAADATKLAKAINASITGEANAKYDANGTIASMEVSANGYYLVKDVTSIANPGNDALSAYIVKVIGSQSLAIKTDAPTLVKKIWHNDTTANATVDGKYPARVDGAATNGWNDVGDNQIGDTVDYFIETSVPDMSNYDYYNYKITDNLSAGLTFKTGATDIKMYYYASGAVVDAVGTEINLNVRTSSSTDVDTEIATPNALFNGQNLTIDFVDLKACLAANGITNPAGGKIVTFYHATLNANALVSASANTTQNNPNTAFLTYSNNPNQSGTGDLNGDGDTDDEGETPNDTGNTPDDTVWEWTYTFEASKVDENGAPLAGAKFSLFNTDPDVATLPAAMSLVEITDVANLKVNGITALAADTRYFRPAVDGETGVTEFLTTDAANKFVFVGLDDTKSYYLKEMDAPTNYAKKETADQVVISDTYATVPSANTAVLRKINTDAADADATVEVQNFKGSTLPTTGGMGTRLFVLGGGCMAGLAGLYIVSKKRSKDAE